MRPRLPALALLALLLSAASPAAAGSSGSARMAIAERSVVVMTAAELGRDREAFVAFSTLPGTTVAQFTLSCKTGSDALGREAMRAFKGALAKTMAAALDELSAARVGPGELFRSTLLRRAVDACRRCRVGGKTFDLASGSLQCQYQIQRIPGSLVGVNSARARGADFFIFVTVLFAPASN